MSDPTKIPRCDAVLQNLPEDRQAEIIEKRKKDGLVKTCAWLRKDAIQVSPSTLSHFCSWYRLKQQSAIRESRALQLMEIIKQKQPGLSPTELFEYGQMFFSTMSLEEEDRESWVSVQQLTTSKNLEEAKLLIRQQAEERMNEKLKIERRKLALLEKKAAQADKAKGVLEDKELNEEEKRSRMKEIFGVS